MPRFDRVIFKADLPLYQAAVAKATQAELLETEPAHRDDLMRIHVTYTEPIDLFMLGFHVGQLKQEGGPAGG